MNLTFAANLTKMIDAGLGREAAPPETFVAVGRTTEYTDLGPVPIASFETNVEAPLRALSVAMEPIQDLHGQDAPYPPGGGANLWDEVWAAGTINQNNGNAYDVSPTTIRSVNYTPCSPDTLYYSSYHHATIYVRIFWYDANKEYISYNNMAASSNYSATSPATAAYFKISPMNYGSTTYNNDIAITLTDVGYSPYSNICLIGGRDTVNVWCEPTYEASADPALTIPLGQTVYGGSLDVVSGVLTIVRASETIQPSQINASANIFTYAIPAMQSGNAMDGICDYFPTVASSSQFGVRFGASNRTLYFYNLANIGLTDIADVRAWFTEHQVTVVYPLAEPITVQLTPEQITTLIGANNVWSDGGDVSLTYGTTRYTEGY